jgi:hypothetical protein
MKKNEDTDHIEILKFFKENPDFSFHKISKNLKVELQIVISTINGIESLHLHEIKEAKKLGYKICRACGCRVVPNRIIKHTRLSILCLLCFKNASGDLPENPVHVSIPSM